MNTAILEITNCLQCPHCYVDSIPTEDSFEHEMGAYCKEVEDNSLGSFGQNGKYKMISHDDWHLEKYTEVPNWCPFLSEDSKREKENLLTQEKKLYSRYQKYLQKWMELDHELGDCPISFNQWKLCDVVE